MGAEVHTFNEGGLAHPAVRQTHPKLVGLRDLVLSGDLPLKLPSGGWDRRIFFRTGGRMRKRTTGLTTPLSKPLEMPSLDYQPRKITSISPVIMLAA